jgi:hypothetical protein
MRLLYLTLRRRSRRAARELYEIISGGSELLTWLCQIHPQLFSGIAEHSSSWPVIHYLHHEGRRHNELILKTLRLGAKTQINLASGRTFSWEKPPNVVAINLFRIAQAARHAPIRKWGQVERILLRLTMGRSYSNRVVTDVKKKQIELWGRRLRSFRALHLFPDES